MSISCLGFPSFALPVHLASQLVYRCSTGRLRFEMADILLNGLYAVLAQPLSAIDTRNFW